MKISHLKTNRIVNPLGFAINKPSFSWIVDDTPDTVQTAAQVTVGLDADFNQVIFDSGKVDGQSINSVSYRPNLDLKPRTRYFWKVRVWGETESAESEIAWFETSKMGENWQSIWITPAWEDNQTHPILYKQFELPSPVVTARAYICGLGLYNLELNGKRVGDEYFTPYCNAYDQWIQYQTYDLTENLQVGQNLISVMLGNGWYKGRYGADGGKVDFYGDRFALLCEIHITLENGDELIIVSDPSWKAQPSPILQSDIFDGEIHDARIEKTVPSLGQSFNVIPINIDMQRLEARRSLPVCIHEEIKPVAVIHTPTGETVLDFGQNMTGWVRFKTNAPSGTRIYLQFGEVLQGGNFFRDNLRTAKAEYTYIADGTKAVVEPYFTFYGFQYVKVVGWVGDLNRDDFTGCVIYSQLESTSEIETSNAKVNQLIKNVIWGQKGNFLDIPTDCPQRDERLGWTGDIQIFSGTACFNMDVAAFLSKYLYDLGKEQSKTGGMVPHIIPMANLNKGGSAAWGDAATIVPWNVYDFYGSIDILEQQFESMCAWVDYIRRADEASGSKRLWTGGTHFGDWLSLDVTISDPTSRKGGTPEDFIASAFYYHSARLVARAAAVLGKKQHADEYQQLAADIQLAIQKEYFTETGRLAVPTQTGYVLALFMDLVPAVHRKRVEHDFITLLQKDKTHLRTGFVGTPYICRVLSNIGANDLAYKLLLNEDYPSWLYAVNLGATTIWERWNSINPDGTISSTGMNSLNHYAYGSIVEWMFRDMCGLNPSTGENGLTGFRHALIAPKPDQSLQWAKARYRSAAGYYESGWKIDDTGKITVEITIPFNATAKIVLPDAQIGSILVNGNEYCEGIQVSQNLALELKTGHYSIEYQSAVEIAIEF
ncbi:MAG: glycoside hydrolase family 78 protein [Chloroflexi bacterium]|nr:glycoside hydrolase family 78 protein [Chloroflexota bacterium]MCC6891728.1 family 78 glycoside hydrolase catalytic domain [Anaerolineae bacterium]